MIEGVLKSVRRLPMTNLTRHGKYRRAHFRKYRDEVKSRAGKASAQSRLRGVRWKNKINQSWTSLKRRHMSRLVKGATREMATEKKVQFIEALMEYRDRLVQGYFQGMDEAVKADPQIEAFMDEHMDALDLVCEMAWYLHQADEGVLDEAQMVPYDSIYEQGGNKDDEEDEDDEEEVDEAEEEDDEEEDDEEEDDEEEDDEEEDEQNEAEEEDDEEEDDEDEDDEEEDEEEDESVEDDGEPIQERFKKRTLSDRKKSRLERRKKNRKNRAKVKVSRHKAYLKSKRRGFKPKSQARSRTAKLVHKVYDSVTPNMDSKIDEGRELRQVKIDQFLRESGNAEKAAKLLIDMGTATVVDGKVVAK